MCFSGFKREYDNNTNDLQLKTKMLLTLAFFSTSLAGGNIRQLTQIATYTIIPYTNGSTEIDSYHVCKAIDLESFVS